MLSFLSCPYIVDYFFHSFPYCSALDDRTNLMKLRSDYKDAFVEKHGVKLGLMSGFVKVCFLFTEVYTSLTFSFLFPHTFYGLHVRLQ